jgi:hypothetical protein
MTYTNYPGLFQCVACHHCITRLQISDGGVHMWRMAASVCSK